MSRQLLLYMQPAYNYSTDKVEYAEVLTRKYKNIDNICDILKYVELNSLEQQFDMDVLEETLEILSKYAKLKYPIGINLCSSTIEIPGISKTILEKIDKYNSVGNDIIIEVNEKTDFSDKNVQSNIKELRDHGIKIALDDFGIQSSNISTLINCKVDILKVDRAFIDNNNTNIEKEESQSKLLRVLLQICNEFNLKHIVEGIETNKQLNTIKRLGYDIVQGYLYEKPIPLVDYLKATELHDASKSAEVACVH